MVFQALMKSCLLYMNRTTTITTVPRSPRAMTTFWTGVKILIPNATNPKAMMLAMVAMTRSPTYRRARPRKVSAAGS